MKQESLVLNYISKHNMLSPGDRVLCALSGGLDSMSLLFFLNRVSSLLGISICAAHFEHGIRGHESQRDARFVAEICEVFSIPCEIAHADVPRAAKRGKLGIEETARNMRYEFLTTSAVKLDCNKIAVAHNADDNAETVLFNLARGSGTRGISGISPVRGRIIRPFLCLSRDEIETYAIEYSIPFVKDSSNDENFYTRNRIRHTVVPALKEINPEFVRAVSRTSVILRRDIEYFDKMAEDFIRSYCMENSVPVDRLLSLPYSISSRVIIKLCKQNVSFEHIEAVLALCKSSEYSALSLPGIRIEIDNGRLYFDRPAAQPISPRVLAIDSSLDIPSAKLRIITKSCEYRGEINDLFTSCYIKYENICGNLLCSSKRAGDTIRPHGRGCTKTLKALFLEAKLSRNSRLLTPVISDDKGPIFVYGLALDERVIPAPGDLAVRIDIIKTEKSD